MKTRQRAAAAAAADVDVDVDDDHDDDDAGDVAVYLYPSLLTVYFTATASATDHATRIEQFKWLLHHKNVPPNFCPYLCQILTDFNNSFTDTIHWKFAI